MTRRPRPCRVPADIEANIESYLGDRDVTARYTSFDYCFNYSQSFRERGDLAGIAVRQHTQISCLQLGFYLASWGMLRGSTGLLQRSVKRLEPVVMAIASAPSQVWTIDADSYSDDEWIVLDDFAREIWTALPGTASNILVTKIMLGVFENVPAFDTNFKKGSRLSTYSAGALRRVQEFYGEHRNVIDRSRVPTLDFETGAATDRIYTRAKVIDMIFFIEGN